MCADRSVFISAHFRGIGVVKRGNNPEMLRGTYTDPNVDDFIPLRNVLSNIDYVASMFGQLHMLHGWL